jgi:hypothetical protein
MKCKIRHCMMVTTGLAGPIAGGGVRASAETITFHATADKTTVLPGEIVTMNLYAKLDPGPGEMGMWVPPPGQGDPQPGMVAGIAGVGFSMTIEGYPVKWAGYQSNPALYFNKEQAIFWSGGLYKSNFYNWLKPDGTPNYVAQDNWLITLKFSFTGDEQGQATVLGPMSDMGGGVWFDVPGQSKLVSGKYDPILEPLVFTIIPSPGVHAGFVAPALIALATRRRR